MFQSKSNDRAVFAKNIKYKIPRDYKEWDKTTLLIWKMNCVFCHLIDSGRIDILEKNESLPFFLSRLWYQANAPVYCLSRQMIQSFKQSTVLNKRALLRHFHPPFPVLMILFPSGEMVDPDGEPVDHVFVQVHKRGQEDLHAFYGNTYIYLDHQLADNDEVSIRWAGVVPSLEGWHGGIDVDQDGNLSGDFEDRCKHDLKTDLDQKRFDFGNCLTNIVVQCLLAIAHAPELIEEEQPKGFGHCNPSKKGDKLAIRYPRHIGRNYKPSSTSLGGTHASPRAHWRRFHWRRVLVGPRSEGKRKWTFIETTLVNGTK